MDILAYFVLFNTEYVLTNRDLLPKMVRRNEAPHHVW